MARVAPVLLALALLLGGCITSDPPAESDPGVVPAATDDDSDDAQAGAPSAPTPAPASPSNGTAPSSSGTSSSTPPSSTPNGTAAEPAPPAAPRTREVTGKGTVTLMLGAPCDTPAPAPCQNGVGTEPVHLALPEKNPSASTLTVTWEAASDVTATLRFDVTDPDGAPLATGEGTSPLVLPLPSDVMRNVGEVVVTVVAPTPGAVPNQAYDLLLALTYAA